MEIKRRKLLRASALRFAQFARVSASAIVRSNLFAPIAARSVLCLGLIQGFFGAFRVYARAKIGVFRGRNVHIRSDVS